MTLLETKSGFSLFLKVGKGKHDKGEGAIKIEDAKTLHFGCSELKVSFVRRDGNALTHSFATFVKFIDDYARWMEEFLLPLLRIDVPSLY